MHLLGDLVLYRRGLLLYLSLEVSRHLLNPLLQLVGHIGGNSSCDLVSRLVRESSQINTGHLKPKRGLGVSL